MAGIVRMSLDCRFSFFRVGIFVRRSMVLRPLEAKESSSSGRVASSWGRPSSKMPQDASCRFLRFFSLEICGGIVSI